MKDIGRVRKKDSARIVKQEQGRGDCMRGVEINLSIKTYIPMDVPIRQTSKNGQED